MRMWRYWKRIARTPIVISWIWRGVEVGDSALRMRRRSCFLVISKGTCAWNLRGEDGLRLWLSPRIGVWRRVLLGLLSFLGWRGG